MTDNTPYYESFGYRFYGGHTFKYYTTKLNWPNAKTVCEVMSGHLATSTGADKNAFLVSLTNAASWLGATDEVTEGTWKWVTSETWDYTNWSSPPQPDNAGGVEHYLELYPSGAWNDLPATTKLTFICEWDFDIRTLSEVEATEFLNNNGYRFYGGHTFKYVSAKNTWADAKVICEVAGGHLATSTSIDKNAFLRTLSNSILWLGGTDEDDNGAWKWITDEDWDYTNWSANEPNDLGEEFYLELLTNGLWNDLNGTQKINYICEWDFDMRALVLKNHEQLNNLQGGTIGEHYHLTKDECQKLHGVLDVLYPEGSETPIFPSQPAQENPGPNPDDPNPNPDQEQNPDIDPYLNPLPDSFQPNWEAHLFPSDFHAFGGVHKMYFGKIARKVKVKVDNKVTYLVAPEALVVPMLYRTDDKKKYLLYTLDLNTWERMSAQNIETYGYNTEYIRYERPNGIRLFFLGYPSTLKPIYYHYLNLPLGNTFKGYKLSNSNYSKSTSWLAACYSPSLKLYLFVSQDGHVCRLEDGKTAARKENITCGLGEVNPSCAAWSPKQQVFCVTGADGTAVSSAGDIWEVSDTAPHNLRDLTYHPEIDDGVFLAWCKDNRLFYISKNGLIWARYSNTPIPLDTVAALNYNPDLGLYCAIGVTDTSNGNKKDKYAYFTQDLVSWTSTIVSNAAIPMGSVIWAGGDIKKYILMPTEGSTYYTLTIPETEGD